MSAKKPFTASKLRLILSVSLFVIAVGAGAIFYAANHKLRAYATDVSTSLAMADSSQDSLHTLQQIERELAANQGAIERTAQIVADSKSYQYQDQIIRDLNSYAARAGIVITNIDFTDSSAPATSTDKTTAPSSTPTVSGVKSTSVSITLQNPVGYTNLLNFLHSIEQNLTKMQIASVNLSQASDSVTGVTSNVLTLEVYIR